MAGRCTKGNPCTLMVLPFSHFCSCTVQNGVEVSQKTKRELPYEAVAPFLSTFTKGNESSLLETTVPM
jgi:hypothetical protein